MKTKKLASLLPAIGLSLALASSPASAVIQFFSPFTNFEDDNLDYIVDSGAGNIGAIGTGDRIITVLKYNQTFSDTSLPVAIGPEELTGVSDFTVGAALGGGSFALTASGAAGVLSGFAPNTAVALWKDTTPDFNPINAACGSRADCLQLAGLNPVADPGSTLFVTALLLPAGGSNTYGVTSPGAGGVASIATIESGGAGTTFGFVDFGLVIGVNNTGQTFGPISCAPFCGAGFIPNGVTGSGNLLGGVSLDHTQWTGRSDSDARVAIVPEPGSMALLGLAIVALGVMRRRNGIAG